MGDENMSSAIWLKKLNLRNLLIADVDRTDSVVPSVFASFGLDPISSMNDWM